MTLREGCVFAVAILGGTPSTSEIRGFLAADGWQVSRGSARGTLSQLRGAALEITEHGQAGFGCPTRWRLTEAARAWLAEGECCSGA
jgi:hypothetical protein